MRITPLCPVCKSLLTDVSYQHLSPPGFFFNCSKSAHFMLDFVSDTYYWASIKIIINNTNYQISSKTNYYTMFWNDKNMLLNTNFMPIEQQIPYLHQIIDNLPFL